ncbi:MAG TPA: DUF983 domain-containing protein [Terriglobia bacterium]|nr:DUF983 domain-containing protein [Terriglobia bacterium]
MRFSITGTLWRLNFGTFFKLRCPVCGRGKIFHGYLDTPGRCPDCGFYFMRETGYFLPHAPISYLAIVFVALVVWVVVRLILGVESDAVVLTSIIVIPALFALWSNRYAKMLWLVFDLWLHPPTQEDFEPRGRD